MKIKQAPGTNTNKHLKYPHALIYKAKASTDECSFLHFDSSRKICTLSSWFFTLFSCLFLTRASPGLQEKRYSQKALL